MSAFQCPPQLVLDDSLCCVASHLVRHNLDVLDMRHAHAAPMIIDGLVCCNASRNVVIGYSATKSASEPETAFNFATRKYEVRFADGAADERVLHMWRQQLDALVLSSTGKLYGVKVTRMSFRSTRWRRTRFPRALTQVGGPSAGWMWRCGACW